MPTMKDILRAQGFDTDRNKPPIENYNPDDPALEGLTDDQRMALAFSRTDAGQMAIYRLKEAAAARARAAVVVARFNRQVLRRIRHAKK